MQNIRGKCSNVPSLPWNLVQTCYTVLVDTFRLQAVSLLLKNLWGRMQRRTQHIALHSSSGMFKQKRDCSQSRILGTRFNVQLGEVFAYERLKNVTLVSGRDHNYVSACILCALWRCHLLWNQIFWTDNQIKLWQSVTEIKLLKYSRADIT